MNDKKKQKNDEFLDEVVENNKDNVEYLDDEFEEDNMPSETK
jgi:hypothetical protein